MVFVNELLGQVVLEVGTCVRKALMRLGKYKTSLSAVPAAFLASGQSFLFAPQIQLSAFQKTGIRRLVTFRFDGPMGQPHIDAQHGIQGLYRSWAS